MLHSSQRCTDPRPPDISVKTFQASLLFIVPCYMSVCLMSSPVVGIESPPELSELTEQSGSSRPLTSVCMDFNALNTRIRDNRIDSRSARIEIKRTLAEVRKQYYRAGGMGTATAAMTSSAVTVTADIPPTISSFVTATRTDLMTAAACRSRWFQ